MFEGLWLSKSPNSLIRIGSCLGIFSAVGGRIVSLDLAVRRIRLLAVVPGFIRIVNKGRLFMSHLSNRSGSGWGDALRTGGHIGVWVGKRSAIAILRATLLSIGLV